MIHSTAIVDPSAEIDPTAEIGPYAVIDGGVRVGPGCVIGPYVYLTGLSWIGQGNRFFAGCVIGEAPQDLKYKNEPTGLRIGDRNVFREHVTVHRSTIPGEETRIGSDNFLMQHSHVAHNVVVGDQTILGGGALLAGHARVADRAFVSGNCLVHQFARVGTLAMMQGGSAISKDLAPFTMACEENSVCGLNTVGLRRAGISGPERLELRRLYHLLFRSGLALPNALAQAQAGFSTPAARAMLEFIAESRRGVCGEARRRQRLADGAGHGRSEA